MAEHLSLANHAARALLSLGCLLAGAAAAQSLADPTRPPSAFELAADPAGAEQPPGPRLQSILIAPDRRVAVVSGKILMVGDQLGDAKVIRISEGEVALRKGRELQILRLHAARPADAAVSRRE